MEKILQNIESIRKEKGLKQSVLAEMLGITQAGYSQYIKKNKDIKYQKLVEIANVFEMDIVDVIKYPDKWRHCTNCAQEKDKVIQNLNDYIEVVKQGKK